MKRIQLACCCLIASAMVLGGMILLRGADHLESQAHASMIVTKGNVTLMSAKVDSDKEMIYVLDNQNAQLLGYLVDANRKRIELMATMDVQATFEQGLQNTQSNNRRRPRR